MKRRAFLTVRCNGKSRGACLSIETPLRERFFCALLMFLYTELKESRNRKKKARFYFLTDFVALDFLGHFAKNLCERMIRFVCTED